MKKKKLFYGLRENSAEQMMPGTSEQVTVLNQRSWISG